MAGGSLVLVVAALLSVGFTVAALVDDDAPPVPALVGVAALATYVFVIKPWTRRWGTTPDERRKVLPGDEQIPHPGVEMTRAITIDAPPEGVWPWIAQIGQDHGGFYSYAWLEDLAGCQMPRAHRLHPEWQNREIGDVVPLHPLAGIPLTRFDPNRSYALGGWYFALEPRPGDRTRLYARSQVPRGIASIAYALFIELPHFIMERKMLLMLKRLAEQEGSRFNAPRQALLPRP